METTIHKKTRHIGCPIYIRRKDTTFEYLTVIKNEIYSQEVIVNPTLTGKLMFLVGAWKTKYTEKQLKSQIFYMIAMAETTIETALHCDEKGKKIKAHNVIKIKNEADLEKIK
jgi:hypothetical protein